MPELIKYILMFLGSLIVLVKFSDYFIEAAQKISLSLGIPAFIVGITLVALGTSLPELVASIFAVLDNSSDIVVSNVVGSNIANVLLVLGIIAIIGRRVYFNIKTSRADWTMFAGSAILLTVTIMDGTFSPTEGIICLIGLTIYLGDMILRRNNGSTEGDKPQLDWHTIPLLIISIIAIPFSAKYTIQSIIELSHLLDIGTAVISLTAVAIGTSLPELFVSLSAVKKGNADMALGNILGSNIFNIFAVMGIPAVCLGPLDIPPIIINISLPFMLIATALYFVFLIDKKLIRSEGIVMLMIYLAFLLLLFR